MINLTGVSSLNLKEHLHGDRDEDDEYSFFGFVSLIILFSFHIIKKNTFNLVLLIGTSSKVTTTCKVRDQSDYLLLFYCSNNIAYKHFFHLFYKHSSITYIEKNQLSNQYIYFVHTIREQKFVKYAILMFYISFIFQDK